MYKYHFFTIALLSALMLACLSGGLAGMAYLLRRSRIRHRHRLRRATKEKNEALRAAREVMEKELLKTRIEVQENALNQLSMEIHDNVGQVLSWIRLRLSNLAETMASGGEQRIVSESSDKIGECIGELRGLSHIFSEHITKAGNLCEALAQEIRFLETHRHIRCRFEHPKEEDMPALHPNHALLLFRIAQEALQNIVRHSGATHVECRIDRLSNDGLQLQIRDNGKGFAATKAGGGGLGLKNIAARVKMLHGNLDIRSFPGQGCQLTVRVEKPEAVQT